MTNGEKMQEIFPEGKTRRCRDRVVFESDGWCHAYGSDWWSAEYKEPTTKNNLGVDCIDRAQAQTEIEMNASRYTLAHERGTRGDVEWSDNLIAIDEAVDIIRNLPSVTPQEPKPMVEIDLYSVIKQKYIEREVLDKIRAEITELSHYYPMGYDYQIAITRCLEVIDKYKAESEEAKTK